LKAFETGIAPPYHSLQFLSRGLHAPRPTGLFLGIRLRWDIQITLIVMKSNSKH
jgi:hypothetical protein